MKKISFPDWSVFNHEEFYNTVRNAFCPVSVLPNIPVLDILQHFPGSTLQLIQDRTHTTVYRISWKNDFGEDYIICQVKGTFIQKEYDYLSEFKCDIILDDDVKKDYDFHEIVKPYLMAKIIRED